MVDLTLDKNLDIIFDEFGDLQGDDYLNTCVMTALFTDKRVGGRRGHFSMAHDESSKLWVYEQARINTNTLVEVRAYTITALKFLLDDELVVGYGVNTKVSGQSTIIIDIAIELTNNKIKNIRYELI